METERRIKMVDRDEFKKKKLEIIQTPYKDYFKEGMKKAAIASSTRAATISNDNGNLINEV
jgi:hypothetical protein